MDDLFPSGGPRAWTDQAANILRQVQQKDDPGALNYAIALLRQAVWTTAPGNPDRRVMQGNLGSALKIRYERTGHIGDLNAAIEANGEVVAASDADDPNRATYLSNLSGVLADRFELAGDLADINAAIEASVSAVASTHARYQEHAALCVALLARFVRTGSLADLNAAIESGRTAVRHTPDTEPNLGMYQSNLGVALLSRFNRLHDVHDLDDAITAARAAVEGTPLNHPDRAGRLANLATARETRARLLGRSSDPVDAVAESMALADAAGPHHPKRGRFLSKLGDSLLARFDETGDLADINAAVEAFQGAIESTIDDHPEIAMYLSNLGHALHTRFEALGSSTDLNGAILAGRSAIEVAPPGHPDRARYLTNLGDAFKARFEQFEDTADLTAALSTWREAAAVVTAPTENRMVPSHARAVLAATQSQWDEAAAGYSEAVDLLPFLAWRGSGQAGRSEALADWAGLASDAAACAIASGQNHRAVELLEQGRAVLWSQLLETRTDLDSLRRDHPPLAAELDRVRSGLDQSFPDEVLVDSPDHDSSSAVDFRMTLAVEWDRVLSQVRALPGYADFGRPPAEALIRAATAGGSVVFINISQWRCDALIVTGRGVEVLELPGLTRDDVLRQTSAYLDALQKFETARPGFSARQAVEQAVTGHLQWLWNIITAPVLDFLDYDRTPGQDETWPRIWWCPTGPLAVSPLHAAGYHDKADGRSVLDRVVSSYTPTLRALAEARARPKAAYLGRLLFISLPETPGMAPLTEVRAEEAFLLRQFASEKRTVLTGSDATRSKILEQMSAHILLHASCHGSQDLAHPSRGGLIPYDWQTQGLVGVLDTTRPEQPGGDFAFLAACKTATGGINSPDEAITLASAMHYAGWRHVIGTLWSIGDDSAAEITESVYSRLTSEGDFDPSQCAQALHDALRRYRDNYLFQPSRWAPFLHTGP